ncbi:MAG: metal-dependent transcriptional regulator [Candidatus Nanopelagicales bacterium]|jgi:DtxR family Mn-dependent transcriptional regulator
MSGDLIDTTEMYLRTVYELEEEGVPPLRARIADRLGHSGPTVSQTVSRMERDGLIHVGSDRQLELTDTGRNEAMRVMRKHRLAECLLVDVIGLPLEEVHAEACRWEHVISDSVERRLLEILNHPRVSPFGNPIPGLGQLSAEYADLESSTDAWMTMADIASRGGGTGTIRRIFEPVQPDVALMLALRSAGVRPGAVVSVNVGEGNNTDLVVSLDGQAVAVPRDAAEHIVLSDVGLSAL